MSASVIYVRSLPPARVRVTHVIRAGTSHGTCQARDRATPASRTQPRAPALPGSDRAMPTGPTISSAICAAGRVFTLGRQTSIGNRPRPEAARGIRRYLESESGCLRCKRRGCFVCLFLRGGRITWTASPPQASASFLSLLFFELSGYYVSTVWLHVNAADFLVRRRVDRTAPDNRLHVGGDRGLACWNRPELVVRCPAGSGRPR
jgi:hypothetical protein